MYGHRCRRRRRRRRSTGNGMDGAALSHFPPPASIFHDCGKRKNAAESNEPRLSPRNTAKLCISSKERNLRRFASFSVLCVFSFRMPAHAGRSDL